MKLIDAIRNVDRSPRNTDHGVSTDELARALGVECYEYVRDGRLTRHHLIKWICTDAWVGTFVYYLDDEPVAIGQKPARKSDETISFVSEEAADKLRSYLISLIKDTIVKPTMIDQDEEIGDSYSIVFGSQLLTDEGFILGETGDKIPVKVVKKFGLRYEDPVSDWEQVEVQLPDGEVRKIGTNEFHIPYLLRN